MRTDLTRPIHLEESLPVATKTIDYVACIPWLIELGFRPADVFEMVTGLLAYQQRTEDQPCG